jgi:hypothetical protein
MRRTDGKIARHIRSLECGHCWEAWRYKFVWARPRLTSHVQARLRAARVSPARTQTKH